VSAPISADIPFRDLGSHPVRLFVKEGTAMDDTDARKAVQESMDRRDQGASS
jgi:hypothetical protein